MTTRRSGDGRGWAYFALILGVVASVAANVGHACLHGPPAPGAVASAVLWPVLVLVSIELLAKTVWPTGWAWATCRYAGVGIVGLVAALVSYRHVAGLLASYGEDRVVVALGPLAIDGLMAMASASLLAAGRIKDEASPAAEVAAADEVAVEPTPTAGPSTVPATPTPSRRTPGPSTRPAGRPGTKTRPSTRPAKRSSKATQTEGSDLVTERTAEARRLIATGELSEKPSAAEILRTLGGKATIAREVRERLHNPEPTVDPDQMAIDELTDPQTDHAAGPQHVDPAAAHLTPTTDSSDPTSVSEHTRPLQVA